MDHRHFGYTSNRPPPSKTLSVCGVHLLLCLFSLRKLQGERQMDRQTDRWSSPSSRKDRGPMCFSNERRWKGQAHNMHWCCWTGEQWITFSKGELTFFFLLSFFLFSSSFCCIGNNGTMRLRHHDTYDGAHPREKNLWGPPSQSLCTLQTDHDSWVTQAWSQEDAHTTTAYGAHHRIRHTSISSPPRGYLALHIRPCHHQHVVWLENPSICG